MLLLLMNNILRITMQAAVVYGLTWLECVRRAKRRQRSIRHRLHTNFQLADETAQQ